jgi:hypothetical protein
MLGVSQSRSFSEFIAGPIHGRACKAQMKTVEYHEGPEAKAKFDQAMRTAFQAPKPTTRKTKQKSEVSTTRKTKRSDKN